MQMRYVIGALLVFGALASVSLIVYRGNQELYFTVDELVSDGAPAQLASADQSDSHGVVEAAESAPYVRVRGGIDKSTVERADEGLEVRFALVGDDSAIPVVYHGLVPDTFEQADEVTVRGRMGADGQFDADELMVQCPSKYEAELPGSGDHPSDASEGD
jgi:cytochrome c-type biogenesis protein CcmE